MLYLFSAASSSGHTIRSIEVLLRAGPILGLAILLMIVWVISFLVYHIAGFFIHLLIIVALILFVVQLFAGKKR